MHWLLGRKSQLSTNNKLLLYKTILKLIWTYGIDYNSGALSPRVNYTDRATAATRRRDCQLFADRGCHVVSVTYPYGRILGFLDRSSYFSIK
jgi:hypothetical protein